MLVIRHSLHPNRQTSMDWAEREIDIGALDESNIDNTAQQSTAPFLGVQCKWIAGNAEVLNQLKINKQL